MKKVTVVLAAGSKTVEITGQHGTQTLKIDNPVEIGIAVTEQLTGQRICQPYPYRRSTDPVLPRGLMGKYDPAPEFLEALEANEAVKGETP